MEDRQPEYPATFTIAELASASNKKKHSTSKAVEYASVVLAAVFAIVPAGESAEFHWPAMASAVSLLVAIVVLFVERILDCQNGWYETRALAEATKAESWLFRCRCGRYSKSEEEATGLLLSLLDELQTTTNASRHTAGHTIQGDEISQEMLATRGLSLPDRVSYYRRARIDEQQVWYASKAKAARGRHGLFLSAALATLLCGLVSASLQAFGSLSGYSLVGVFSAFSAGLFAWMQMRRYEAVAITYTRASNELRSIGQLLGNVTDEQAFCERVRETEQVISKEHEIWAQK